MLTGLALAFASSSDEWTHTVSMIVGPLYGVLGIIGLFVRGFNPFGVFPITGLNVALFIVLGVLMLFDWLSTPTDPRTTGAH
jgi:hypothetical protein